MAFLELCLRPDGRFHNFISAEGKPLDEVGSEDSHGRAVWALAFAARLSPQLEVRVRALRCLDQSLGATAELASLRARAFVLLGLQHWLSVEPAARLDELMVHHASALLAAHASCASPAWNWFEDDLTYENARLPQALLVTPGFADLGLETLAWLCQVMDVGGQISLIGCNGWYPRDGQRAEFDQQPVDAGALVAACLEACRRSDDSRFRRWAQLAYDWFSGSNVGGRSLIDSETGGCYDGLTQDGVNANQGAESLLAWLLAWEDMTEFGT